MDTIRILMLLSLFLQTILAFFGDRRKYATGFWLRFVVWLAYMSADWVATFSLGFLACSQANSANPNLIPGFWAPILLLHLGGPETITAYSLADNELWRRHLLELVIQAGVAFYVLFKLWSKNTVIFVAIPIFVSGIIKYGERIWAFRFPSLEDFGEEDVSSSSSRAYEVKNVREARRLFRAFKMLNKASNNLTMQPSAKQSCLKPEDQMSYYCSSGEARYLLGAHILFGTSKMLFQNLELVNLDQEFTYDLVYDKKAEDAFQLIEIELGLKYDRHFSKVATLSWPRIILRSVTFLSSIFALVSFSAMIKSKSAYSKNDRNISYVLLGGVVCLETYSIMRHLFSDWTMFWLSRWKQDFPFLYRFLCLSRLLSFRRERKRWPGLMGQHNLISALSKKPVNKVWKQYFPAGNWNIHDRVGVEIDLKELIFQQVKEKRSRYDPDIGDSISLKNLLEERGSNALIKYKHCFDKVRWSLDDAEFSHSLLTWHIATHICFLDDTRKNNGFASTYPNLKMSRSLSNYMLYLLVQCPTMLAIELRGTRYNVTTIHLRRLLYRGTDQAGRNSNYWGTDQAGRYSNISMDELDTLWFPEAQVRSFFYELLGSPSTMLMKIAEQDEGEMSALLDGCMLGLSLQSLETGNGWSGEKKWEMVSEVWVEMMMYAASHCGWKEHTDALARGGELLTHVCLLMAHLGLCKQCPPEQNSLVDARIDRLYDILNDLE
ncbi:F-box protein [Salix suchowensis]|nr:F-box protein [Salix suchowensis]